jgi:hypothetical protein
VALVGGERHPEVVLLPELVLRLDGIGRDPQNVRAGLLEVGEKLREINGFTGAAGVSALG